MARKPVDPQAIEQEVAALGGLPIGALRERWKELFGYLPPSTLRREFLIKACAYQMVPNRSYLGVWARVARIAASPLIGLASEPTAIPGAGSRPTSCRFLSESG